MSADNSEGIRHLVCGQVTMPKEIDREDGMTFCVQCGRMFPVEDFVTAKTHKDLK